MLIQPFYILKTTAYTWLLFLIISTASLASRATPAEFTYRVLDTKPHNPNSFIQGWIKDGDTFFESSGRYQRSFIQRYTPEKTVTEPLPKHYFAEGLTLWNNTLYVLTWKEQTLLVIDKDSLHITQRIPYQGEGWGLTHNNHAFIMSNGTSTLFFRDLHDFSITHKITVKKTLQLNELEYINGIIWANNWREDRIYAINSVNGCLIGSLDLSALRARTIPKPHHVLNGIAYDKTSNALWVTGKYWPTRYLISLPITTLPKDHTC